MPTRLWCIMLSLSWWKKQLFDPAEMSNKETNYAEQTSELIAFRYYQCIHLLNLELTWRTLTWKEELDTAISYAGYRCVVLACWITWGLRGAVLWCWQLGTGLHGLLWLGQLCSRLHIRHSQSRYAVLCNLGDIERCPFFGDRWRWWKAAIEKLILTFGFIRRLNTGDAVV